MKKFYTSAAALFIGLMVGLHFSYTPLHAEEAENEVQNGAELLEDPVAVKPEKGMVPTNLFAFGDGNGFSEYAFIADKEKKTLTIWRKNKKGPEFVEAHPMDIGRKQGDKTREGDLRTPEGIYFVQEHLEGPGLNFEEYGNRAFPLDYPNFFDRKQNKTGSGIWLHAVPDTTSLFRGSRGCVVVRNEIVDHIKSKIVVKKTPVIIMDEIKFIKETDLEKKSLAAKEWLENWRQSWESQDIDKYMEFYAEDFRSQGMNNQRWRNHKANVSQQTSFIQVGVSSPLFLTRNDEAIVKFYQTYKSETLEDFGKKTLFLRSKADGQFEIIGEEWVATKIPEGMESLITARSE